MVWQFGPVRLWPVSLAQVDEQAWQVLSADEQARAARFRFEPPRLQFVATRAALRRILGRYCHVPPTAIRFAYGPHGKPSLAWPRCGVHFNVSHTDGLALCALAPRPVGVDVERVRAVDVAALAGRVCAPAEVAALLALPPAQQTTAFFVTWTRKEAYVKARGVGFAQSLRQVVVQPAPRGWQMWDFAPQPGYVASVALPDVKPSAADAPDSGF